MHVQVELVVDEMRRSLARRAGVDRRLPQFVGMSGFQDYAINIVVLVSQRQPSCAGTGFKHMHLSVQQAVQAEAYPCRQRGTCWTGWSAGGGSIFAAC